MKTRFWWMVVGAMVGPAVLVACSDDPEVVTSPTPASSGTYRGVLSGGKESGVLEVTVAGGTTGVKTLAAGSSLAVSATLKLAGSTVSLTGTYDPATGAFSLSGGGYTLTGTASAGGFSGTYTGPNGTGSFVLLPASQGDVSVFCGAFKGDDDGVWNVGAIQGGSAVGAYASRSGTTGTFAGDWKNNVLTLKGNPVSATGNLDTAGGAGTWTSTDAKKGTWSTGACVFASTPDAGGFDAAVDDATTVDAADAGADAITDDASVGTDAGTDGATGDDGSVGVDAGIDDGSAGVDASVGVDSGSVDASVGADSGSVDASVGADSGSVDAGAGPAYEEVLTDSNMCNLAADLTYIYIGYCKNAGIKRIAINGDAGAASPVVNAASTIAMTVANNTVYWIDNSSKLMSAPVGSVSATGTQLANASNITGSGYLRVSNGFVYWVDHNGTSSIMKVATTGGTPVALVTGDPQINSLGVDDSTGDVYYGSGTGELRRVSTGDAGAPQTVKAVTVRNVQYEQGFVFWTEAEVLWRKPPGGAATNVTTLPGLAGAIVWSDFVYFKTGTGGLYQSNAFADQTPSPRGSDSTMNEWVLANPYLYWRTNDAAKLRRVSQF